MSKWILHSILLLLLLHSAPFDLPSTGVSEPSWSRADLIFRADSLYRDGRFNQALLNYRLAETGKEKNPEAVFRMAYAAYRSGDFQYSRELFAQLEREFRFLPPYTRYFFIKSLWASDPDSAVSQALDFIRQFGEHPLADSLLQPVANYLYQRGDYRRAYRCYQKINDRNLDPDSAVVLRIKAARAVEHVQGKNKARNAFYQIIKKYPAQQPTLKLVETLRMEDPSFYEKYFWSILEVYFKNNALRQAEKQLTDYIQTHRNQTQIERARYNLIRIYYTRGQYRTALYGFKNLLKTLHNKKIEPHIRLYIARSYRRAGMYRQAIEAYLDYARRYPRRRMASEVVWKAAWMEEQKGHLSEAMKLYRMLVKRWPRSKYAPEANFREGFDRYRTGEPEQAAQIFRKIVNKKWSAYHKHRAQFWLAYCLQETGDTLTAKNLRVQLAENLWDDYYTMRSYLWHKSYLDTTFEFIKEFRLTANPLLYYGNGISNLIDDFEQAFQVSELLGKKYSRLELERIKRKLKSREEWIALAEMYKKFGAYGQAYRTYDWINRKYYRSLSFVQKSFMLKERFPFYYDNIVEKYARRYGLEKELIYAIIKQESKFDPAALSHANAYGLMQLMPFTAKDMAALAGIRLRANRFLFEPELNIHLGSLYVKQLDRMFAGDKKYILAAYNAGPHRVKRWRKIPGSDKLDIFIENIEFSETRQYVKNVLKNYWAYKLLTNNFEISDNELLSFNDGW